MQMSSTTKLSKEQLTAIATLLKHKLISPSSEQPKQEKKAKSTSKTQKKVGKIDFQINSDSEVEAMELFQEMKVRKGGVKQNGMQEEVPPIPSVEPKSILKNSSVPMEEQSDKQQRAVIIREQNNVIYALSTERKWKDVIQNQKKGKFELEEQRLLSDAVGQFLVSNGISLDQFTGLISEGNKQKNVLRRQKFYKLLSSVLPNRSPESCYRFIVRNFNNLNRQGQWSAQEVDRLLALVDRYGRKWKLIGKELNRTSDNVYDKYRSLGEESMESRIKSLWKLREVISLLTEIERQSGVEFLDHNITKELQEENEHDNLDIEQLKSHKYNTKTFVFHHIQIIRKYIEIKRLQSVNLQTLRWKKIVKLIPTKNIFDCRNKMVQILQILFRNQDTLDVELVAFMQKQKVGEESKLDWKRWQSEDYTSEEGRNRFMILKKLIEGRSHKPFKNIMAEIELKIKNNQKNKKAQKVQ